MFSSHTLVFLFFTLSPFFSLKINFKTCLKIVYPLQGEFGSLGHGDRRGCHNGSGPLGAPAYNRHSMLVLEFPTGWLINTGFC